jgi:imidazole glycerol-phosphate synthase subunit HisH
MSEPAPMVAIVDYGMGNLFSVQHACTCVGLRAVITSKSADLDAADAVILPGVGAFSDAMQALQQLDIVETLQRIATGDKPFLGICLGLQLLMTASHEFGHHRGLDVVPGEVVRFMPPAGQAVKVPHMGWNRVQVPRGRSWDNTLLRDVSDGEYMYFVHSYYVQPVDVRVVLSTTSYASINFCSSLIYRNVLACQFHPERSGQRGLCIYQNLAACIGMTTATEVPYAQ